MKTKHKIKTVDTGAFIVPIYDIATRWLNKKENKFEFVYIPIKGEPEAYDVYGYRYKTGKGWQLILNTDDYNKAKKVAKEYNEEMYNYWELKKD